MIRLTIVGTGGMANAHAGAFAKIPGCKVVSCCDVIPERADAFAEKHGIKNVFYDADELIADGAFDAMVNVTIDAFHAPISLAAIKAGKHVFCEKPLATCYADAKKMTAAAKRKGVINMVNLSYRSSSAIQKAHEMIAAGKLGKILHFEASYLQSWLVGKAWGDWRTSPGWLWRLSQAHGSKGVLGDIGVHIIDFAMFAAGDAKSINCHLKTFPKAKNNRVGDYTLDANDTATIQMELKNGAMGVIHTTRLATGHSNSLYLSIHGEKGALRIELDKAWDKMEVCMGKDIDKNIWKTVSCGKAPNMYQRFIRSIKTGKNEQPDFAAATRVQKILDTCFVSDEKGKTMRV